MNLEMEEAQALVQGRWRIFRTCGDYGWQDTSFLWHVEFDADILRSSRASIETPFIYEYISNRKIEKWEKHKYGIKVVFASSALLLRGLVQNDTLYYGDWGHTPLCELEYIMPRTFMAVRDQD
jgi:hypothetical protein